MMSPMAAGTDPNIDPALYMPSKRACTFSSAISHTSSAFLLSPTPVTSSHPIIPPVFKGAPPLAQPDWSLLNSHALQPWTISEYEVEVFKLQMALGLANMQVCVHDGIIEGNRTQMVIQNLHLGKLQSTLRGKENKKKTDQTRLFPDGKGRHLTNDVFIAQLESAATLKENEAAARQQRQLEWVAKKAAAGKEKAAWQQLQNGHKAKVAAWEDEWDHLL